MLVVFESKEARLAWLKDFLAMPVSKEKPLRLTIEIGPEPKKRSLNQNDLLHKWFQIIAEETGNTPDDVKEALKSMFIPLHPVTVGTKTRLVSPGTSALSVAEMAKFMDRILAWSDTELGIRLPTTEDILYGAAR